MWSWYLFIVYFHNVLIMESNTYSYTEYNFSGSALLWRPGKGAGGHCRVVLWFLEAGRMSHTECGPRGVGSDPLRSGGRAESPQLRGFRSQRRQRADSRKVGGTQASRPPQLLSLHKCRRPWQPRTRVRSQAQGLEKSGHQPTFPCKRQSR